MVRAALPVVLLIAAACGKVGDPLPPFVRIPEPAGDLAVEQAGYEVRFRWTNPSRNLDQSLATDLETVLIRAGEEVIAEQEVTGPGQLQTFTLPARNLVGATAEYSVSFRTEEGRVSAPSPPVRVTVVEVPEGGPAPTAEVDQGRVRLRWPSPAENPELADGYRVFRSGELLASQPSGTLDVDDRTFVEDMAYAYTVVPLRTVDGRVVEGVPYETVEIVATDRAPPAAPVDPRIIPFDGGAFVQWGASAEADVARYRVYRRTEAGSGYIRIDDGTQTTTAYTDREFQPGFQYAVSALDESGNESPVSETPGAP